MLNVLNRLVNVAYQGILISMVLSFEITKLCSYLHYKTLTSSLLKERIVFFKGVE